MNPSLDNLNKSLVALESITGVSEFTIMSKLHELRNMEDTSEPCSEWKFEVMAFTFCENYYDLGGGWGTYFGPMSVQQTKDGTTYENPNISLVDKTVIDYWRTRSNTTNNALLKARYSGLIWDLGNYAAGIAHEIDSAINYILAVKEIAEKTTA